MPDDPTSHFAGVPRWLVAILDGADLSWLSLAGRDGRLIGAVVRWCPACADTMENGERRDPDTSYVKIPGGQLVCKRPGCPASVEDGLPLGEWVRDYLPQQACHLPVRHREAPVPVRASSSGEAVARAVARAVAEATAFVNGGPQRIGVVSVTPGGGKTRVVIETLASTGVGSFLTPSHDLGREHRADFERLGGTYRQLEGVVRLVRREDSDLADLLVRWGEHGWSYRHFLDDDERRVAVIGDGEVPFGTHAHLAVAPVSDRPEQGAEPDDDDGARLWTPLYVDEGLPSINLLKMDAKELRALVVPHSDADLEKWLVPRRPLLNIVLKAVTVFLRQRRSASSVANEWPDSVHTKRLREALLEAAGGDEALRAAFRECPATARWTRWDDYGEEWGYVPPRSLRGHLSASPPPTPPRGPVRAGDLETEEWVRGDLDAVLMAIANEVLGPPPAWSRGGDVRAVPEEDVGKLAVVMTGRGPRVRAGLEVRRLWSAGVRSRDLSFVLLDGTAIHTEEALRAAWPGFEIQFFRVDILPDDPGAVDRVWLKVGKGVLTRRALIDRRADEPRLKAEGIPTLVRLLQHAFRDVNHRFANAGRLVIMVPKPILPELSAAAEAARGAAGGAAAGSAPLPSGCQIPVRIREAISHAYASGQIAEIAFAGQGTVRGSNAYKDFDAVLTLPFFPNKGAINEDARALRINADELLWGLSEAEIEQEEHRIRPVWATLERRRLLMHAGTRPPAFWKDDPAEHVSLPGGGRVPSTASNAASELVLVLVARHGAASAGFIRWIAENPDRYRAALSADADRIIFLAKTAAAGTARMIERAVKSALPMANDVLLPNPVRGRGQWKWREILPRSAVGISGAVRRQCRHNS